jgi:hypothetical protein
MRLKQNLCAAQHPDLSLISFDWKGQLHQSLLGSVLLCLLRHCLRGP